MGRKSLKNQVIHRLNNMMALGKSRHQAKRELRLASGGKCNFAATTDTIHSSGSRKAYQQTAFEFVNWCVNIKGINKYAHLDSCKVFIKEYLQARVDAEKSEWTLKKDRSAFHKLFGEPIDFPIAARTPDKIKRSRGKKKMDRNFSKKNNRDLIIIAKATGGRREDIGKMRLEDFRTINGRLYVEIRQSKGGRDRITPIRPDLEKDVLDILAKIRAEGRAKLFTRVHTKADIHSYRREYAQELYKIISHDRPLRDILAKVYPARYEPNVKGTTYTTRRAKGNKSFNRDDLYLVSQALGHNRLEVAVTNYLL